MIQASPPRLRLVPVDERPAICHVIHAMGIGGAEVLVSQLVRRLSDSYRFVIAVLDEVGDLGHQLSADGFVVEHLHRKPGIDRGCAARLRQLADREGVCLFHAHQYTPFFQAMLSRGLTGRRPVVFTEHGRHFPDLPGRKRILVNRLLLRKQDRLIGVGEAVRQALIVNEGLPESRVEVIYNGVNAGEIARPAPGARQRIRNEFGFGESDFLVLQVARLHALKDHQTAIRAIDCARQQIPRLKLLLVGDGDQRSGIEESIRQRGLQDTVFLAGTRTDVSDLLAASDAFLLTSISEGIPLTVIEAMVARCPVVATAVGGLPEMIDHRITGLLAPASDDESLAAGIVTLCLDSELRSQIVKRASDRAIRQFSIDGMLDGYRAVYSEVLSGLNGRWQKSVHRTADVSEVRGTTSGDNAVRTPVAEHNFRNPNS